MLPQNNPDGASRIEVPLSIKEVGIHQCGENHPDPQFRLYWVPLSELRDTDPVLWL